MFKKILILITTLFCYSFLEANTEWRAGKKAVRNDAPVLNTQLGAYYKGEWDSKREPEVCIVGLRWGKESTKIDYDLGNIDNVFTKKYRQYGKDTKKLYNQNKQNYDVFIEKQKQKHEQSKKDRKEKNAIKQDAKQAELDSKMEVKATPIYDENNIKDINLKNLNPYENNIIEIKRTKKNNLIENYDYDRPDLRDYY